MSSRGSVSLGLDELIGKLTVLDVACRRCDRRSRLSLERLITEHGVDTGLPDLWDTLAGGRPHARSTAMHDRCAIHYPELPGLFLPPLTMKFMADTIAAAVLTPAMVGMAISVVGLIGCGALLTRRH
jgi:hypothetical protein